MKNKGKSIKAFNKKYPKYYIPINPDDWTIVYAIKIYEDGQMFSFMKKGRIWEREYPYLSYWKQDLKIKKIREISEAELALII